MGIKLSELAVMTPCEDRRFCALYHPVSQRWVEIYRGEKFLIHKSYIQECISHGMKIFKMLSKEDTNLASDGFNLYKTPEEAEANARKDSYNRVK